MDESIFSKKTKELEKIAQEDWEQFLNITENEPWWNLTGYVLSPTNLWLGLSLNKCG